MAAPMTNRMCCPAPAHCSDSAQRCARSGYLWGCADSFQLLGSHTRPPGTPPPPNRAQLIRPEMLLHPPATVPPITRLRLEDDEDEDYGGYSPDGSPLPPTLRGRLEIFIGGQWATVCDTGFTDAAAHVVCKQLGLAGGTALPRAAFGPGHIPIAIDRVKCRGGEARLSHCKYTMQHRCNHGQDVSVACTSKLCFNCWLAACG